MSLWIECLDADRAVTGAAYHRRPLASNAEIARELFVSELTVKSHIGHIFTKLDLRDRAAAIVFAYDHASSPPLP